MLMQVMFRRVLLGLVLLCGVCQNVIAADPPKYSSVRIDGVPHVRQKPDFCGEACAEMSLRKLGVEVDQDWVYDQAQLDPTLGRGCYTKELTQALERSGFEIGTVWYHVPAQAGSRPLDDQFAALHQDLKNGQPSIICMRYKEGPQGSEHFRLILGYDAKTDEILYHEPAEDDGAYRRMLRSQLLSLWPLKYAEDQWTVIRMRLKLAKPPTVRKSDALTDADYCQHVLALKSKLPGDDFHFVIQRPFVVIGDEAEATVQKRATQTVKWAVDHLKQDYFAKDPTHILDIWLFKDEDSYRGNVQKLFKERPTTPYGYYSPKHKSLIMNIATGGGTLVHEIVHPFMASNFPGCPSWFNEGLASLYEQSNDANGHIRGETNWRLQGLQKAIQKDRLETFETLCGTTTTQFYEDPQGTHYGQARYLCYYLQEKGLLRDYYREFRKNSRDDPTGFKTLKKILHEDDIAAFQKRWEEFILNLKFP